MTTFVVCNECGNRWKVRRPAGFPLTCSVGWFLLGWLPWPFSGGCAVCPMLTLPHAGEAKAGVCCGSHWCSARTRTVTLHAALRLVLAQESQGWISEVQLLCPSRCSHACSSRTPARVHDCLRKLFFWKNYCTSLKSSPLVLVFILGNPDEHRHDLVGSQSLFLCCLCSPKLAPHRQLMLHE